MNELQQEHIAERQRRMALLAKAALPALEKAWKPYNGAVSYRMLRTPEYGMVMVRARAGNTGTPFNLGEAVCTRCAVTLQQGNIGFGYVLGRNKRHAELAAVFDALSMGGEEPALEVSLFTPLEEQARKKHMDQELETEATRVDFLTLVRGE